MNRKSLGLIEGWVSIFINTVLFVLKMWAGISVNSVSMVADAWHTISDSLSSIVLVIGFCISGKHADEEHPFGHGRAESIVSVIIVTILAFVGLNFIKESVIKLRSHSPAVLELTGAVIFLVSAAVKELLAQFSFWAARRAESVSLEADGWHHRSDAVVSVLIVAGMFFGRKYSWIDGVMGLVVSFMILAAAYDMMKRVVGSLLGESVGKDLRESIIRILCLTEPRVKNVHHIHIHRYGDHVELTLHVILPGDMALDEVHGITNRLEDAVKAGLNMTVTIHAEPENR
ncbi:MAG: cation transporter [Elusimicrobia bacterium]|nr:cation transporter [Elusimicrobiota bacterium]